MNDTARNHLELIRVQAGGVLRPADVLRDARNPNSPLHLLFTWDDTEAAEAFRMIQARKVIRAVITIIPAPARGPVRVRAYTASPPDNDNAKEYRVSPGVLADPKSETEAFRALSREIEQLRLKYAAFPALERAVAAFKNVLDRLKPDDHISTADTPVASVEGPTPFFARKPKAGHSVAGQQMADDFKDADSAPIAVEDAIAWGQQNKAASDDLGDINEVRRKNKLPPFRIVPPRGPFEPLPPPTRGDPSSHETAMAQAFARAAGRAR